MATHIFMMSLLIYQSYGEFKNIIGAVNLVDRDGSIALLAAITINIPDELAQQLASFQIAKKQ